MPRERGENGQYRLTVEERDVLQVFDAVRGPVVTSADVADELNVSRETGRRKLNTLVDEGILGKRKTAGRVVYWRADEPDTDAGGEPAEAGAVSAGSPEPAPEELDRPADAGEEPEREPEPDTDDEGAIPDVVDRVAEAWEDSPERLEARKAAARGVLEYAREHGGVSKQEAKEEVFPEYPVEGQNPRTWYRKNIRPVLNEAAEYNQSTRQYELTLGV